MKFLACVAIVAAMLFQSDANAADRGKPTSLVVNFTAGGPLDVVARLISQKLEAISNRDYIVENKPGASGNIGAAYVARSAPDGRTVLFTTDGPLTANQLIYKNSGFKPDELKSVALIGSVLSVICVPESSDIKSLDDLIETGRRAPMSFSASGYGSPAHIGAEMLALAGNVQVNLIPYKGGGPAALAVAAGEVQAGVLAVPALAPFVSQRKMRPLAVASGVRSSLLPNVATAAELGYPDIQTDLLFVVMVPAATPDEEISQLKSDMAQVLADPELKRKLNELGVEAPASTTAQAADESLANMRARYVEVVKRANLKVD